MPTITLPVPGSTAGPLWATQLVAAVETVNDAVDEKVSSPTVLRIIAVPEGDPLPTLLPGDLVVRYTAEEEPPPVSGYYWDWETDTVGATPAGWSGLWTTAADWQVVSGVTGATGKCLRSDQAATGRFGLTPDSVAADPDRGDVEFLLRYKQGDSSAAILPMARAGGATATEVGYRAGYFDVSNIRISSYTAGTTNSLANLAQATSHGTWYMARFRVNGTALKYRRWADGATEPGTWDLEVTDAAIPGPGLPGLMAVTGVASYVDWIAIATGGDTAVQG